MYNCDDCVESFKTNWHLKRHQQIHSVIRRYKFESCHKSFANNFNWKRHQRIHTGVRPYKCDVCKMSFTTTGNLKKQQLFHNSFHTIVCIVTIQTNFIYMKQYSNINLFDRTNVTMVANYL